MRPAKAFRVVRRMLRVEARQTARRCGICPGFRAIVLGRVLEDLARERHPTPEAARLVRIAHDALGTLREDCGRPRDRRVAATLRKARQGANGARAAPQVPAPAARAA